jgi:SIR2-like domain
MAATQTFPIWRFGTGPRSVVWWSPSGETGTFRREDPERWERAVAAEEKRRTVFIRDLGEPWVHVYVDGARTLPTADDLAAASAVLEARGQPVEGTGVRGSPPGETFPAPLRGSPAEGTVYSQTGLEQQLDNANRGYVESLVDQLRSPLRVLPFVGAGLSAEFGFPMWDAFLREAATAAGLADVLALLDEDDYEGAAEKLEKHSSARFSERIAQKFRRRVEPDRLRDAAVSYVPLLSSGPVVTTNFDRVLEDTFEAAEMPFEAVISGPHEDLAVAAIHGNRRQLLKIHGTYNDRTFRVFTKDEYKRGYEGGEFNLESLAWLTFVNRPLLFLGCSLEADRTVAVLAEIHRRLSGLKHYAILAARYDPYRLETRNIELAGWGVSPIWFPPGRFDCIRELLRDAVEEAGTARLRDAGRRHVAPGPRPERPLDGLSMPSAPDDPATRPIAQAIASNQLTIFLGAGAHLDHTQLGDGFYADMAAEFGVPAAVGDRSEIAALVAQRKSVRLLWEWVRERLSQPIEPSVVYRLVAALPAFLRRRGVEDAPWVATTNYDTVLEQQLAARKEPFHVIYWMQPQERFAHVGADGSVRVIERPEAIRDLRPACTVILKLNGGIVYGGDGLDEAVAIAAGQFERVARAIPDALPACARAVLRERGLLFLGHGLREPDVKQVIRYGAEQRGMSWAVRRRPVGDPEVLHEWGEGIRDLERLHVKHLERELSEFTASLHRELTAIG